MVLREALQSELTAAMQRRDGAVVTALRTALAAIANAEAPPEPPAPDDRPGTTHVAGATAGLAATEGDRLVVPEAEQRALVERERAELLAHADRLARLCRHDDADATRRAAATLAGALRQR